MTSEMMKKRKRNLWFGVIAAALMMLADLLWQARGAGAVDTTLGAFADKAWLDMSTWRFVLSDLLAAAAVPLYYIGFTEMFRVISDHVRDKTDRILATLFRIGMLAGTMAFIFIHVLCVNMPLIMQGVAPYVSVEKAAEITNSIMMLNIAPMVLYFLAADGVLTVVMFVLILRKTLPVNRLALLCNPVCAAVIGTVLGQLPWPLSQISFMGEACGHLLIMIVGLIIVAKDEKQMPKLRKKKPKDEDDRPIINLDDEPDAEITMI